MKASILVAHWGALAVFAWTAAWSHAAVMPISEGFDDDPVGNTAPAEQGDSWIESPDADWSVMDSGGEDHVYRGIVVNNSTGYQNVQSRSALPVTDVVGGEFSVTSEFTLADLVTSDEDDRLRTSLAMLCDNSDFTGAVVQATFFFLDEFNNYTGQVQLAEVDGSNTIVRSGDALTVSVGTTYSWTVTGSYAGGLLNVHASLTDGTDTVAAEIVDATYTASSAQYFGFQDDISRQGGSSPTTLAVDHDDYTVVPEPATLSLIAAVGLVFLRKRAR